MTKKISIVDVVFKENDKEVELLVEQGHSITELKPMEQMLVDSDNLSFIYITDMNDEYTYVAIPYSIWLQFNKVLNKGLTVYLTNNKERIPLPGFIDELSYLIENIKGNSNYGEEMVAKVEETF